MFKVDLMFLGNLCKRNHEYENSGKSLRYRRRKECVVCKEIQRKEWISSNQERYNQVQIEWRKNNKTNHAKWKKEYRKGHPDVKQTNPFKKHYRTIRNKCIKYKIPFDITPIFLEELWNMQNGQCHWLKCKMQFDSSRFHPLKATIDRIDPLLGYLQTNVVWACSFANRGRVNTPAQEFIELLPKLGFTSL